VSQLLELRFEWRRLHADVEDGRRGRVGVLQHGGNAEECPLRCTLRRVIMTQSDDHGVAERAPKRRQL
jgi:hypothetical protein